MKLEELARQSTNAARVSVAHLEVPQLDGPSPKRSWAPLVAGVAVTALVVGGLAVLARDRTGDDAPADSVLPTAAEVPRLGLALDGWTIGFASSFAELGNDGANPSFAYYGDPASPDDPYAAGDLVIAALDSTDPGNPPINTDDGTTVELRGTTGTLSYGVDQGLPDDVTSLTWTESNADGLTTEIVVLSHSFDASALTDIAEALTIDADAVTPPADLGLRRVATATGTPFDALRRTGEGYVVAYQDTGTDDVALISTARGSLRDEATVMRWWTDQVTEVEVDGRPGFLATFDDPMSDLGRSVTWAPADGVLATVSRFMGGDEPDVVALAGTAFEIDDATWETYLAETETARSGADEFDEIYGQGSGTIADTEYSWVLGIQTDSLCFTMQTGDSSSTSCQAGDQVDVPDRGARTIDNQFGSELANVVIAADPLVDAVVESTGTYTISRIESDGVSWFVAVGDTTIQPSFEVIVDGLAVDTLDAAVNVPAEIATGLADNSAAVELGVTGMDVVAADESDPGLSWWLGRMAGDLCLVTGGAEPSAGCVPASDIAVFRPVTTPTGLLTFVVVTDTPTCVTPGISGARVDRTTSAGDGLHTYEVFGVVGESDGWSVSFEGDGPRRTVELPPVEGIADFPPLDCGG